MKTPQISALKEHSSAIFSVRRALCVTAAMLLLSSTAHAAAGEALTLKQYRRWLETSSTANMDSYFNYAQRAMEERNFHEAEWAFRHLLSGTNGTVDRVKLDLSLSLIAQGKYLDARDFLEEVLRKNPPPQVQQNIRTLLANVDTQLKPHRITGNITMGLNYDTNGNSAPGTGQVTVVNTSIPLDPSAQENEDYNLYTALSVNHTYRVDNPTRTKTIRWKTDLIGYMAKQDKLDQLDLSMMSIRSGPEVTWLDSGVRAGLFASHTVVGLDSNSYLRNPKIDAVIDVPLSGYTTANFATSYEYRKYLNTPTITIYDDRNGAAWQQSFGLRHVLNDTWAIDGVVFFRQEDAEEVYYENDQYGGSIGLTHLFTPSFVFNTRAGYKYYDYKGADLLISAEERQDAEITYAATLAKTFTIEGYETQPSATFGYVYRDMQSNIQNYEYDNHRISTALNFPF